MSGTVDSVHIYLSLTLFFSSNVLCQIFGGKKGSHLKRLFSLKRLQDVTASADLANYHEPNTSRRHTIFPQGDNKYFHKKTNNISTSRQKIFPQADATIFPQVDAPIFPQVDAPIFPQGDARIFPQGDKKYFHKERRPNISVTSLCNLPLDPSHLLHSQPKQ